MTTLPATLPTRPDLYIAEQIPYNHENPRGGWAPFHSIDFTVDGQEGIKLSDAMNLRFNGPDGRDQPMFTHESIGNSVSCRMEFAGRCAYSKSGQIVTKNHKKSRDPITRKKLAHEVAKRILTN